MTDAFLAGGADARTCLTPSELNADVRRILEGRYAELWLQGELSNLARPSSGHWYFTLKDERAQIRCAMFRNRNRFVRFQPENGLQLLLRGRVSLYEARGEYQCVVAHAEPAGQGALRLAFEQTKQRLKHAGLFDAARKRALPTAPRHVAVITSPTGAAVRDILDVLARRWPLTRVTLLPVAVQGEAAASELVAALERLHHLVGIRESVPGGAPEVAIVARGGGSLEDLWGFNAEPVAQALAAAPMPVVTGVGHETDFTIADFVADLRAPTPSAAAELVVPDALEWRARFAATAQALVDAAQRAQRTRGGHVTSLRRRLRHPGRLLRERAQRTDELELRLRRSLTQRDALWRTRVAGLERRLRAASPRARLGQRRAALTTLHGRLVRAMNVAVRDQRSRLERRTQRLYTAQPGGIVAQTRRRVEALDARLQRRLRDDRSHRWTRYRHAYRALHAVSPLNVLERGYVIATTPAKPGERFGAVLRDPADVAADDRIEAHFAAGVLECRVTGRRRNDEETTQ